MPKHNSVMQLNYTCFFTHVRANVDLSKDRWNCAEQMADAYCTKEHKKKTPRMIENFAQSSNLFHKVRDLIEDIPTRDFTEVLSVFKTLYPLFHPDWQSALRTGLVIKAGEREGHYSDTPLIYQDNFTAILIREAQLNRLSPIVADILEDESIPLVELPEILETIEHFSRQPY